MKKFLPALLFGAALAEDNPSTEIAEVEEQAEDLGPHCQCTDRERTGLVYVSHWSPSEIPSVSLLSAGATQAHADRNLAAFTDETWYAPSPTYSKNDAIAVLDTATSDSAHSYPAGIITTLPNSDYVPYIKSATAKKIPTYVIGSVDQSLLDEVEALGLVNYIGPDETAGTTQVSDALKESGVTKVVCFIFDVTLTTLSKRCDRIVEAFGEGNGRKEMAALQSFTYKPIVNGLLGIGGFLETGNVAFVVPSRAVFDWVYEETVNTGNLDRVSFVSYDSSAAILTAMRAGNDNQIIVVDQQMYYQSYMAVALLTVEKQTGQKFEIDIPTGPILITKSTLSDDDIVDDTKQACQDAGYPVCSMTLNRNATSTRNGLYDFDKESEVNSGEVIDGCPCYDRTTAKIRISSHIPETMLKAWPSMSGYRQAKLDLPGTLFDWDLHPTSDLVRSATQNMEVATDSADVGAKVPLFFVMQDVLVTTTRTPEDYNAKGFVGYPTYAGGHLIGTMLRNTGHKHALGVNPWGAPNAWEWHMGLVDGFTNQENDWAWPIEGDCQSQTGAYSVKTGVGPNGEAITARVSCSTFVGSALWENFGPPLELALTREPEIDCLMVIDVNPKLTAGILDLIDQFGRNITYTPAQLTSTAMNELMSGRMDYGLDDQLYLQHYVVATIAALHHHTGERSLITHLDTTRIVQPSSATSYVDLQRYQDCSAYGDTHGFGESDDGQYFPQCTYEGCGDTENRCSGQGQCVFDGHGIGHETGRCLCSGGWTGDLCETRVNADCAEGEYVEWQAIGFVCKPCSSDSWSVGGNSETCMPVCRCVNRKDTSSTIAIVSHWSESQIGEAKLLRAGAAQAVADRNLEIIQYEPSPEYSEEDALAVLTSAITQEVGGIVTTMPTKGYSSFIQSATAKKIPVYIIGGADESLLSEVRATGLVNYIGQPETEAATAVADKLKEGGVEKVICFIYDVTLESWRKMRITFSCTDGIPESAF